MLLRSDNAITNRFGTSEFPELVISCGSTGSFLVWVDTENFVTANGLVAYQFDDDAPFVATWIEFDFALIYLQSESMALTWFYETRIAFCFNAFRLFGKLRVNGFHDALADDLLQQFTVGKLKNVAGNFPLLLGSLTMAMNLVKLIDRYNSDDTCRAALQRLRWPSGVACLRCGDMDVNDLR